MTEVQMTDTPAHQHPERQGTKLDATRTDQYSKCTIRTMEYMKKREHFYVSIAHTPHGSSPLSPGNATRTADSPKANTLTTATCRWNCSQNESSSQSGPYRVDRCSAIPHPQYSCATSPPRKVHADDRGAPAERSIRPGRPTGRPTGRACERTSASYAWTRSPTRARSPKGDRDTPSDRPPQ